MAYDDDGSDWRDDEALRALLERLLSRSERLTIPQLADLVNKIHGVGRGRASHEVSIAELSQSLRQAGFANVPIGLVEQVVDAAVKIPPDGDAADRISLAEARQIISHVQG